MSKVTGLAAFTNKGRSPSVEKNEAEEAIHSITSQRERSRGKGNIVTLTVRLPRAKWERLHQLAVAEGVSIQSLAVDGLSKVFVEKGLPSLSDD